MRAASDEDLKNWFYIIHRAVITMFTLQGEVAKLTATQIIAFQNDRGLELTTLEKLKAYLIPCVYRNDNAKANINSIESKFTKIYSSLEYITTNEDTVLSYHCSTFISTYENPLDVVNKSIKETSDKIAGVLDFVQYLCRSYALMENIEEAGNSYNCPIADICILDCANVKPLVLKLCHFNCKANNVRGNDRVDNVLRLVERILFKMHFSLGDYRTNNLISIAKGYSKDHYVQLIE